MRTVSASVVLTGDDDVAFSNISENDFGHASVSQPSPDEARLDILAVGQYPDLLTLPLGSFAPATLSAAGLSASRLRSLTGWPALTSLSRTASALRLRVVLTLTRGLLSLRLLLV